MPPKQNPDFSVEGLPSIQSTSTTGSPNPQQNPSPEIPDSSDVAQPSISPGDRSEPQRGHPEEHLEPSVEVISSTSSINPLDRLQRSSSEVPMHPFEVSHSRSARDPLQRKPPEAKPDFSVEGLLPSQSTSSGGPHNPENPEHSVEGIPSASGSKSEDQQTPPQQQKLSHSIEIMLSPNSRRKRELSRQSTSTGGPQNPENPELSVEVNPIGSGSKSEDQQSPPQQGKLSHSIELMLSPNSRRKRELSRQSTSTGGPHNPQRHPSPEKPEHLDIPNPPFDKSHRPIKTTARISTGSSKHSSAKPQPNFSVEGLLSRQSTSIGSHQIPQRDPSPEKPEHLDVPNPPFYKSHRPIKTTARISTGSSKHSSAKPPPEFSVEGHLSRQSTSIGSHQIPQRDPLPENPEHLGVTHPSISRAVQSKLQQGHPPEGSEHSDNVISSAKPKPNFSTEGILSNLNLQRDPDNPEQSVEQSQDQQSPPQQQKLSLSHSVQNLLSPKSRRKREAQFPLPTNDDDLSGVMPPGRSGEVEVNLPVRRRRTPTYAPEEFRNIIHSGLGLHGTPPTNPSFPGHGQLGSIRSFERRHGRHGTPPTYTSYRGIQESHSHHSAPADSGPSSSTGIQVRPVAGTSRRNQDKNFKCHVCRRRFTRKTHLTNHLRTHGNDYECPICRYCFKEAGKLHRHLGRAHTVQNFFICRICSQPCTSLYSLHIHQYMAHTEFGRHGTPPTHPSNPGYGQLDPMQSFERGIQESHSHHSAPADSGPSSSTGIQVRPVAGTSRRNQDKNFKCNICGKCFTRKTHLTNHLKSHGKVHVCFVCRHYFKEACQLQEHIRRVHTAGDFFICQICSKRFLSLHNLQKHQHGAHTGRSDSKRYKCTKCREIFFNLSSLKEHMKLHETGYTCKRCFKIFPVPSEGENHEREHAAEDLYPCVICTEEFQTAEEMNEHCRNHRRRRCEVCGKEMSLSSLANHMKLHRGHKPFECQYCPKKFTNQSDLSQHIRAKHPHSSPSS